MTSGHESGDGVVGTADAAGAAVSGGSALRAVHFGAGNIGRGFIGLVLHQAGYRVTFIDTNGELIGALRAAESYQVHEVGERPRTHTVDGIDGIDSKADEAAAVRAVAAADVVTCAVGPGILRHIAPVIREGLRSRPDGAGRLSVMACENAIGATDTLAAHVLDGAAGLASRAVFANTAVDRIIPAQSGEGLDVEVEPFSEWSIDRTPFGGSEPVIPGAHFVDDLTPYIERKLFTVNTGHATIAYHGAVANASSLADALASPSIRTELDAVLAETSGLLVEKFGFDAEEHAGYVATTIARFANPALPDTPTRVGRQPLRKLGRHERFVQPAAEAAERGLPHDALVRAIGAALRFDVADDPEAIDLRQKLRTLDAAAFTTEVTGLEASHPLFPAVVREVERRQAESSG
ncbi:mannitol-1-phosphate 5-dehydrogenase [Pseudoclavibacter endophyticus]|uniref:Mannitol-1-phosphate 5-dehydrogenase n=1 Tax=Pseudoclavibacter endophyticus TaxID=1778590 RepID=A0A6H9WMQ4_9MICO|nr:mannitol-1-phosphate 5-dehydrogenase [Pseudoclavibacter endophyticus]KAB1649318.1 mannitol-1-phosphate 5-dehydrogenase [Pseudoclavibacter endophyticus]GGA63543.1 mannitol-1-phosphate 5-dehydrogenase [Pseudoclavibacter endophyticus]